MKHIVLLSAVLASATLFAASPTATQDWVRYYVATSGVMVSTNTQGNSSWTQGEGIDQVTATIEMPTSFAMIATNCDATAEYMGLTNNTILVYHRPLAVFAAPNASIWVNVESNVYNYVTLNWLAMTSTVYEAETWLATDGTNRHAKIMTTYIPPSVAFSITNGLYFTEF